MDGLRVLEHLKAHPQTRHIPVHVVSGSTRSTKALSRGAVAYVEKPVSKEALEDTFAEIEGFLERKASKLLIVEDDERERQTMVELDRQRRRRDHPRSATVEEALDALASASASTASSSTCAPRATRGLRAPREDVEDGRAAGRSRSSSTPGATSPRREETRSRSTRSRSS